MKILVTVTIDRAPSLGTADHKLVDGSGEPFFVLNCDNISEYPFAELVRFQKTHSGETRIMVTKDR